MPADACSPARTTDSILVAIVVSFSLGITWAGTYDYHETLFLVLSVSLSALILAGRLSKSPVLLQKASCGLLPPLFFLLGAVHAGPFLKPPGSPLHIYHQIEQRQLATISGKLQESPYLYGSPGSQKTKLLMTAEILRRPAGEIKTAGLVLLTLPGPPPTDLVPGDRFMARALLARPDSFSTPGSFNYREFLAGQGIWITGWVESPLDIVQVRDPGRPSLVNTLLDLPEKIRHRLAAFLDINLGDRTRGIYKAILISDWGEIPPDIIENFKATGCSHILSISGLHMGLLGLISIAVLNWLLKRSTWLIMRVPVFKLAALLSLLPLFFYALIAGMNTPVVRSLIMVSAFIFAVVLDRQKSIITNIALAALLLMIWQPAAIFTASFQLSFGAVIAIALIFPKVSGLLLSPPQTEAGRPKNRFCFLVKNWLLAALLVSVAAVTGTAPLLVYHFNRLSLLSPLTNLLVEPLICYWSLLAGLLASLLLPISPIMAAHLLQLGEWGLLGAEKTIAFFAGLPLSSLWLPTPKPAEIAAFYILLFSLLNIGRRHAKTIAVIAAGLLIACQAHSFLQRRLADRTTVSFLDVGTGSAAVLELPQGRTYLIDGGGRAGASFDIGERVLAPFLWQKGLTRINGIIITHPHADHYNGLFFVIERFRPEEIWINGQPTTDPEYHKLLALAGQHGSRIRIARPGENILQSGNALLQCLANPGLEKPAAAGSRDPNSHSLVLRLAHQAADARRNVSFLFPGDIGSAEEEELVRQGKNIKTDILLSPHHGSGKSNSQDFLMAVSPSFMVISSRSPARPQLPGSIRLYSTAEDGAVVFSTNGEDVKIETFLNRGKNQLWAANE